MKPVNVGICGLGTVGYGTYQVLTDNSAEISRRLGQQINVSLIGSRKVKSGQDIGNTSFSEDVFAVTRDENVDIVVELIGGETLAKDLVLEAISNGKHVVTANKALIALHGNEIFAAAREKNVVVAYEASVAGGIPIIKAVREGLAANNIDWLMGIINGTGNFILTEMQEKQSNFDEVLKQAQELGYAEADPTFDVEGIDAAHKLTILGAIAFGIPLQFEKVFTEGISKITTEDIQYARELGYRIKHLGIARKTPAGIEMRVHPTLVAAESLIANVNGVLNAVLVHGNAVGPTLYNGAGAGALPTASAVVADIIDVCRYKNCAVSGLGFQNEQLSDLPVLDINQITSTYYLRVQARDKAGVLSDITEILGEQGISIEAVIQKEPKGHDENQSLSVVILTDEIKEENLRQAISGIEAMADVSDSVIKIRVEKQD